MPPAGGISGKVTYKGQPFTAGTVVFHSVTNPSKNGASVIGADGSYVITDAPPGPTKVTIVPADPKSKGGGSYSQAQIPKAAGVKDAPAELRAGPTPAARPVTVPNKYTKAESTPLSFTVREGTGNVFDIDLTD